MREEMQEHPPQDGVLFPTLFPRLILGFFRDAGAVAFRNAAVTSR
jgi:hypothetical protein